MTDIINLLSNNSLSDLTGNRFWLDGIKKELGFSAEKCSYITFCNIVAPYLIQFKIQQDGQTVFTRISDYTWCPAGITSEFYCGNLRIKEKKYITKEDIFTVVLSLKNTDSLPHRYDFSVRTLLTNAKLQFRSLYSPNYIEFENVDTHTVKMRLMTDVTARNILRTTTHANIVFYSSELTVNQTNDTFFGSRLLRPGECTEISVSGAISHVDSVDDLAEKVKSHLDCDLWNENDRRVMQWFEENVPQLRCSDPILEKLYYYRWYIVFKNLINPEIDCFNDFCMYEGKDQFAQVCSASAAMHIREMRWLKKHEYVMSEMKSLLLSQIKEGKDKGRLRDTYISDIPTAVWETYCLLPDTCRNLILSNRIAVLQYVEYQQSELYFPESAPLPVVVGSWRTAAEYQPAFFEFTQPQWDHEQSQPFEKEHLTQLHRVDDSTYLCTNMAAVSKLYHRAEEDTIANSYASCSAKIQQNILHYMWDDNTKFFYDLCPRNLRKAWQSKSFDGFIAARIEPSQQNKEDLMDHLRHEFNTPFPIPTVATDCPAFSPDNTWKIGPHATSEHPYTYNCCWNGPSWNFANSLVIDALGETVQGSKTRRQSSLFAQLFNKWCREQCPRPGAIPNSCEHYNPFTGEELRTVRDYSHSTFIDILMRRIIGIRENADNTLLCQPLDIGLSALTVTDIPYQGHTVDFDWNKERHVPLQVFIDKKLTYESDRLSDFCLNLERIDNNE